MRVKIEDRNGNVIKERKVKGTEVAPGIKRVDVNDLFAALSGK